LDLRPFPLFTFPSLLPSYFPLPPPSFILTLPFLSPLLPSFTPPSFFHPSPFFFHPLRSGTDSQVLQFGVLIIPDIYANAQQQIATLLGSKGKSQITNFVQNGGM
jgi:hypothetical protein